MIQFFIFWSFFLFDFIWFIIRLSIVFACQFCFPHIFPSLQLYFSSLLFNILLLSLFGQYELLVFLYVTYLFWNVISLLLLINHLIILFLFFSPIIYPCINHLSYFVVKWGSAHWTLYNLIKPFWNTVFMKCMPLFWTIRFPKAIQYFQVFAIFKLQPAYSAFIIFVILTRIPDLIFCILKY